MPCQSRDAVTSARSSTGTVTTSSGMIRLPVAAASGGGDCRGGGGEHREVCQPGKLAPVVDHPEQHDARSGGRGDSEPCREAGGSEPSEEGGDREHGSAEEAQLPLADGGV